MCEAVNYLDCYPKCTLHRDFGRLLESKQFCDVEFIIFDDNDSDNKTVIQPHIAFVATRSQFLRNKIRSAEDSEYNSLLQSTNSIVMAFI